MNKNFTGQDCIHLHACRRLNAMANRALYGATGTQKMARGCNDNCSCYLSSEKLKELLGDIDDNTKAALRELDSQYNEITYNSTDPYFYIQRAISAIETGDLRNFLQINK